MKSSTKTRAANVLAAAGIPLSAALDPARRVEILALPGISRKLLSLLEEEARAAGYYPPVVDLVLEMLQDEYSRGLNNMPGISIAPLAERRAEIARELGL
jgi:hypothetical protein